MGADEEGGSGTSSRVNNGGLSGRRVVEVVLPGWEVEEKREDVGTFP